MSTASTSRPSVVPFAAPLEPKPSGSLCELVMSSSPVAVIGALSAAVAGISSRTRVLGAELEPLVSCG
ncbi:hypothetical protein [Microbacterium sp. JZ37]|uniref:hypothetical protein n=1 Tax=Microbacterium sp. JZ37 TaxID=2654193 RepID=UPI002B47FDAB|nr:hypothetical protein [Microbacterium sp. JZ37]WRH17333.1 hypothetical protein GC092_07295 [Microbacterium sp. JZ37]